MISKKKIRTPFTLTTNVVYIKSVKVVAKST
jgi:hypothetical protein